VKTQSIHYIIAGLLLSFLTLSLHNNLHCALTSNHNVIIRSNSQLDLDDDSILYESVKFTQSGLEHYLKHVYNHPKYAQDVLPNDFSHLIQFLDFGKRTNQDEDYVISSLRLFHQKFFSLEYISANQLNNLIKLLPELCSDHKSPQVESMILRLVENTISRIIWSPEDRAGVWGQFSDLGNKIENLRKSGIIHSDENCNDLLTALVARFSYIIGLIGSDLPIGFYNKADSELATSPLKWMEINEAEDLIATKLDKVRHTLLHGYSNAQARSQFGALDEDIVIS